MSKMQLSPRKERYAQAYVQHHNSSLAAREAGYSANGRTASVTGARLLADVCVSRRIQALEAANASDLGVTRQKLLYELQAAAALAKAQGDPASMVAAWREIGKAAGLYPVGRVKVDVNVDGQAQMNRLDRLSDAELLRIIEAGRAATPAFEG